MNSHERVRESNALWLNAMEEEVRAAPAVKRADLMRLSEPPGLLRLALQVHRNYAFELVGSIVSPFLWLSRLKPEIMYGDYDDSLTFAKVDPAAVQIVTLDFERYGEQAYSPTFADWFAGRLRNLRAKVHTGIVVSNWPSEHPAAKRFNSELEKFVAELPMTFIWDLTEVLHNLNGSFFDERAAAKGTRLSNPACIEMARKLGLVRLPSVLFPRMKAIALDLDNTLFDGVLGEDGVDSVRITPEHIGIYHELIRLREEGVFLAALSKNDERDFHELCRSRADFLLKPEHFSAISINWGSKPEGLREISNQLRIGTDSILVVDDNLGEITQLRAAHSSTPLLHSQSPSQTLFWLRHYPTLNGYRTNAETQVRIGDLQASRHRELLRSSSSVIDYVREMQIELAFTLNSMALLGRLAELSQKTNQFNTGLQRFSEVEVARRLDKPGYYAVSISLRDRFCDSGVIGAIFARIEEDTLAIDEIAVSCRALGRTVESPMVALALQPIMERNRLRNLAFFFRKGPRNEPALTWLRDFTGEPAIPDKGVTILSWASVPQLREHLQSSVTVRWESPIL